MRYSKIILSIIAIILMQCAVAQNRVIKGKVIDVFGAGVAGASIKATGSSKGVASSIDGSFSLNIPITSKQINVSGVGLESQLINLISNSENYIVKMKQLMICCDCYCHFPSRRTKAIYNKKYQVIDEDKNPLLDVLVKWSKVDSGYTDSLGFIKINKRLNENFDSVLFSKSGYEDTLLKGSLRIYQIILKTKKGNCFQKKSIIENRSKLAINLYPNPIQKNGLLNIKLEKTGNYKFEIFNILGKTLETTLINNETKNNYQIQLNNNMLAGNYFVRLTNVLTKEMIVEKFIIK